MPVYLPLKDNPHRPVTGLDRRTQAVAVSVTTVNVGSAWEHGISINVLNTHQGWTQKRTKARNKLNTCCLSSSNSAQILCRECITNALNLCTNTNPVMTSEGINP